MNTKIEDDWNGFEKGDSLNNTGIVLKRYSAAIIPDCYIAMRMPGKVKSIAFGLSTGNLDASSLSDLKEITTEIIPNAIKSSKYLLLISLSDNSLASIFAVLSEDLFNYISSIKQEDKIIIALQNRFLKWKELFTIAVTRGLSAEEQIGLFGELYLLKMFFVKTGKIDKCLDIWVGPDAGIRDFEKDNSAIEVKTTQTHNQQKIKISSERQLDTSLLDNLFLFHLSLEKRNGTEYSLNTIVDEIYLIIKDDKLLINLFNYKLISAGYFKHQRHIYENISYIVRDEGFYKISDDFLRIEEKDLRKGVGDVKYSIVLTSGLEKYKSDLSCIIKKFELQ